MTTSTNRPSLRVFLILVGLVALVALAPSAGAHTGQGNATPGNDGWHPWDSNLCSWSPNAIPPFFDFKHACKHHDGGYAGFPSAGRPTYWVSRYQCDRWFLADTMASCRWQHGFAPMRVNCEGYANRYYAAVRSLGWNAYKGPWRN